ncbi:MAG: three-Cys-motif partner protein TcmP [Bryobacterales bacterium]|nr:three-Cys-motif partner protein TcmP [Bryobacterales bacterium]
MLPIEHYKDRPQTYLKHFFLEQYLETVAYHIGFSQPDFVFVDGFSGPWRATDAELRDTSFSIAIQKLQSVSQGLKKCGKNPRIRCLFVEQRPKSFRSLEEAVRDRAGVETRAINGAFEDNIGAIAEFVGSSFSLVFIDPTGWNVPLNTIRPLLCRRKTEVIVNFMWEFANRFTNSPDEKILSTFDEFFGSRDWRNVLSSSENREETAVSYYCEQVRRAGGFEHVVSTKIQKHLADRTYFHLVYATNHLKGLRKFRDVENALIHEQDEVRLISEQNRRVERSHQPELFGATEAVKENPSVLAELQDRRAEAQRRLIGMLQSRQALRFEEILAELLLIPMVSERVVVEILLSLEDSGLLVVDGRKKGKRKPELSWIYRRA